ncbi:type I secretion system permease/ATPase [Malaciobacter molluscorum LMG 25693]|uniref:Type I secretion system ATPase/permease, LssB family n=1 Tax=Malaciobacter molluscorum LMG 25693 TaxID=870501 RepID=A0A2G1DG80_9BACT|nr:type I secretion system permease/ATPase [Malaciobacter molluscorum]AXX93478.1 type I secretion system ATPase/permease, LssB family [Malaciobacter molluscorum LMG 25693]PHO17508.1 type I secretion system permease/ATPase [Malaciobacter molluscorum LMG 25693]RXJ93318.1 type I secretion system permease/ATPase [Malaciobacter molluscorum]
MSNETVNDNKDGTLKNLKDRRQVDDLLECLVFLSKYHKRETSHQSLTFGLPIHKSSMNVDMFLKASKRIGLTTKVVKRAIPNITKLALPSVLILGKGRACVLLDYDIKEKRVEVIIPGLSSGVTTLTLEKLESEYTGELIIVKPEFNFNNRIENEVIVEQPKEWFWGTLKRNRGIYKQVIIVSLFVNMLILATPLFTMNVYDRVLPNNAMETLWALFFGISLAMIFDFILKLLRSYFLGLASKRADTLISNRIFNQLLNIKIDAKPASTGQFVSRLQSFESVREFFTSASIAAAVDFPFILIFITVIFYIGGPLGYITILTVLISVGISWYIQRPLKSIIENSVKEEQIKHTTLIETVTGLEIIKSIRAQNRMRTHWDQAVNKTIHYSDKGQFLSQTITFLTAFISQFSNILIVAAGVYLAGEGEMTMGAIIASMMLNGRVIAPVSQLVGMIIKYDKTMLSLNNLDEVMKMPVEKENKTYISRPNLSGKIEFKDVQFAYKNQNHQTLKNINLTINQGERIAILGKIGSGKSTLLKLLMNLYEPTKGSVLVDGVDIRQIDPVDLRQAVGFVPQEPFLFMGTIKDNITIGEQYVSDEELLRASKVAGLDEFLGKHEAGYDLIVGERGEGLSGGERQSVTLARALISNPNILMLDEPTNSMDRQTEKMFIDRVEKIVEDKTLIVVTHKTSLLRLVNRVIIVENGQIILDGPKEEVFNKMSK